MAGRVMDCAVRCTPRSAWQGKPNTASAVEQWHEDDDRTSAGAAYALGAISFGAQADPSSDECSLADTEREDEEEEEADYIEEDEYSDGS